MASHPNRAIPGGPPPGRPPLVADDLDAFVRTLHEQGWTWSAIAMAAGMDQRTLFTWRYRNTTQGYRYAKKRKAENTIRAPHRATLEARARRTARRKLLTDVVKDFAKEEEREAAADAAKRKAEAAEALKLLTDVAAELGISTARASARRVQASGAPVWPVAGAGSAPEPAGWSDADDTPQSTEPLPLDDPLADWN